MDFYKKLSVTLVGLLLLIIMIVCDILKQGPKSSNQFISTNPTLRYHAFMGKENIDEWKLWERDARCNHIAWEWPPGHKHHRFDDT